MKRKSSTAQDIWPHWNIIEPKEFNQYNKENIFSGPIPKQKNARIYVYKSNGVCKARYMCDGSPHLKGTETLDHTYAAGLERTVARIFYALSKIHNHIGSGSDAPNTITEAHACKAKICITFDRTVKET